MRFELNNAQRRNHARLYPERAFYDLYKTGKHARMATDLKAGDECVVATPAENGYVEFATYIFAFERKSEIPDEPGKEGRIFFGREVCSEFLSKDEAIRRYPTFFDVRGHFKQQSVITPSSSRQRPGGRQGSRTP